VIANFRLELCRRGLCVVHLAKDGRLGLNVFANQLYNVFANNFIVFSEIVYVSTGVSIWRTAIASA